MVHSLDLDHHTLYQETGQSPGCFCGRQETLPPGDGSATDPVASTGIFIPVPDPQLRAGRVQTHRSHDKKTLSLLAQGPEVVNKLLHVHPYRHPSC